MTRRQKRLLRRVLIIAVAIIITVAIIAIVIHFSNSAKKEEIPGTIGVVTLDGNAIGVFDSKSDAENFRHTVNAGTSTLKVSGSGDIDVSVSGKFKHKVLEGNSGNYKLNLENFANNATIVFKVCIGGDGFISRRLNDTVNTYYFALLINNPNSDNIDSPDVFVSDSTPNGVVHFGETTFQTYGSEAEAQAVIAGKKNQFTIPVAMAKNLELTAEPSEGTARIWCWVSMIDDEDLFHSPETRLNEDCGWTGNLDLSPYSGRQVTITLHAENANAFSHGYSYVSFFVPQLETGKTYDETMIDTTNV